MQIELRTEDYKDIGCDLLTFPVFEEDSVESGDLQLLDKLTRGAVRKVFSSGEFRPELFQACKIHPPAGLKADRLLLLGAAKERQFELARLREVAGAAIRNARAIHSKHVTFVSRGKHPAKESSRAIVEGAIYGNYEADKYKTRDKENRDIEKLLLWCGPDVRKDVAQEGIRRGTITGEATNFCRTLANEPANILTPSQLAQRAIEIADPAGLEVQILEQDEMEKLGMHALLAVSRGSDEPPKLIILRIKSQLGRKPGRGPKYALIGKGVTFDSGGISIKPAEKMEDMKSDMAGGAAVLGAMVALSQLRPRTQVIGLIPAVENLPSGKAVKPGDVVRAYSGKTIEVINTDAEGRLILADAMSYARTLGADHLVDVATLTGACVIALGTVNGGMMGTDQRTLDRLRAGCALTGEKLWQLPIDDEYRKAIRSEIADIKNVGDRWGGAITAGKFLQEFAEETPWVHMDIAGMDLDHDGRPFACKGATGFGVRTLVHLLE